MTDRLKVLLNKVPRGRRRAYTSKVFRYIEPILVILRVSLGDSI